MIRGRCGADWSRHDAPASRFYFLLFQRHAGRRGAVHQDELRGKPLTEFETFKARFEQDIRLLRLELDEFAHKIDGPWSDLMWPFHGGDNIVDDEFMRYIDFVTEICELRDGQTGAPGTSAPRARTIFGAREPAGGRAPRLPLRRLRLSGQDDDADHATRSTSVFSTAVPGDDAYDRGQGRRCSASTSVNLFEQCCHHVREQRRSATEHSRLQQSLYLYAVLLHLIDGTDDFPRRAPRPSEPRSLRPTTRSGATNMPELVADVEHVIVNDDLERGEARSAPTRSLTSG